MNKINRRQFICSMCSAMATIPAITGFRLGVDEFTKCKNDILYFVDNYLVIDKSMTGRLIMTGQQREYLKRISTTPDYFFCAKGRQIGISTANCVFAYWKSIFFDNQHVWIVCKDERGCAATGDIYPTVRNSGGFTADREKVHFVMPSALSSINWHDRNNTFVLDEFAFWPEQCDELYTIIDYSFLLDDLPELYEERACNFIVESTPCRADDYFYTTFALNNDDKRLLLPNLVQGKPV